MKFFKNSEKIKNQALFKRGSYSLAITAIVFVGIILLNVFVRVIDARFPLEYDMTTEKVNTISEENIDFIKDVKLPVEVIVCADKEAYAQNLIATFYEAGIVITNETTVYDYCEQTTKLVEKYNTYNDNITVSFVDPESTEFSAVKTEYTDYLTDAFIYGDIIVAAKHDNETKRVRTVSFADIYQFEADEALSYYGNYYSMTGNNIESALTSAINNATVTEIKKLGIIKGHSAVDYSDELTILLSKNGFEIEAIESETLTQIPAELDAVAIIAPTTDFVEAELDVLSSYLNNDGVLGKGLLYFGDAGSAYLPNLSDFLLEWGIEINDGILFETDNSRYYEDPTILQLGAATQEHDITKVAGYYLSGNNIPLSVAFESQNSITVTPLYSTGGTTVAAPVGVSKDWDGASDYETYAYYGAIEANKVLYVNNEKCEAYVYAFSSVDIIAPQSNVASQYAIYGEAIALAATQSASGVEDTSITFNSKVINEETFAEIPTSEDVSTIRTIFMFVIPIVLIALSIVVYIRRRNA